VTVRIGLLTYADVDNYGDRFFPLLCRRELQRRLGHAEFVLFSPTGAPVEGTGYLPYDPAAVEGLFDALLLAGGEVVHAGDAMLRAIYRAQGQEPAGQRPTDLVYEWPRLRAGFHAWICVGVPAG
jgi:hypothetical protein